jgi:hypothetical protein
MEVKNLVKNDKGVEINDPKLIKIKFEPCSMNHVGIPEV